MQFASSGRFVVVAQWVFAVLLPIWVFIGRGLVGAPLGWMVVVGALYGLFVVGLLLVPPIVTLFDRPARQRGTVRAGYAASTIVLWVALFLSGLALTDGGDTGTVGSALTTWTGMSEDASSVIFLILVTVAVVAWVAALAFAIASVVRGSREAAAAARA